MAKRKTKKRKHHTTRRRKMGGVGSQMETTLMIATGSLVGALTQKVGKYLASKQTVITDPKKVELMNDLITVGGLAGGAALVIWAPHPFAKGLGMGLGTQSALDGAVRIGLPIAGLGAVDRRTLPFPDRRELNGLEDARKTNIGNASRQTHALGLARTSVGNPGNLTRAKRALYS